MLWNLLLIYSTFCVRQFCVQCDRYTSRGTTKTSAVVPAHQSKKSADDDDTIDYDDNHDDVPDD